MMMKVPDTVENYEICQQYCGNCPTFKENRFMESEPHALFCARGVSVREGSVSKGCSCLDCPVAKKYNLKGGWFCIHPPWE
jgi:hypothetical protein